MTEDIETTNAGITEIDRDLQPPMYTKRGIALVCGEGATLWDAEGNAYIDGMSNYGVNILGHAHPAVTEAICRQAGTLISTHQSFANDTRALFLQALIDIAPGNLTRAWLCNSGTEAIEAGIKFARATTGRTNLVAMERAYHGRTAGAGEATAPKPGRAESTNGMVTHVPFDNLDALDGAVDENTAAVIVEPVQGEAGIYPASEGFLSAVSQIAHRNGALLIFDEVQTAYRTGVWFAAEREDAEVDILCTAKALANGVPIGATLITDAVNDGLPPGLHGSTFGGSPIACAAGLATIEAIQTEGLLARSEELGKRLMDGIVRLEARQVREVRGRGLMIGIDLRGRVTPVLRGLQERGVLALPAGSQTLRFLPPLVISEEQIDCIVEALGETLG